jgi:hypothetical protein
LDDCSDVLLELQLQHASFLGNKNSKLYFFKGKKVGVTFAICDDAGRKKILEFPSQDKELGVVCKKSWGQECYKERERWNANFNPFLMSLTFEALDFSECWRK